MDNNKYKELERRTLVVKNFDPDLTTSELLEELFSNFGPVKKIVLRRELAFIEYESPESVAYALTMMMSIRLHGRLLNLQPKIDDSFYYKYSNSLRQFEYRFRSDRALIDQFLSRNQQKQKQMFIEKFEKSDSKKNYVLDRLRRYKKHCNEIDVDLRFNPYLKDSKLKLSRHHQDLDHSRSMPNLHSNRQNHHQNRNQILQPYSKPQSSEYRNLSYSTHKLNNREQFYESSHHQRSFDSSIQHCNRTYSNDNLNQKSYRRSRRM
ncbi:hypothetical protein NH340_JMT05573 [Sarcoptes scabiei]|nr:hypothetical protein NH340_JMT05573 [Sarcoptes scabiei]